MSKDEEINRLNSEIRRLRADLDGLKAFVRHESDDITKHIRILHQRSGKVARTLIDIYNYLWPLVDKVMPNVTKDMSRFHALVHEHNDTKKT